MGAITLATAVDPAAGGSSVVCTSTSKFSCLEPLWTTHDDGSSARASSSTGVASST
eukprot:CAMPEP_0174718340 /NCGR_PEP_ID=MMETSP1094-20130205/28665_1 /TAXON_ID=156173 /ORGANISM="Chrysochromulina brevifilum, Strain UTEX LB 985" /LENGTH=55 /DNA_ID=CAMNT_0015918421 /DNA_START=278 /DNA_END=445 /DNA_ORIENTATION=+